MTHVLRKFFSRKPAYLGGYCTTAEQLQAYWAVTADAVARRVAGLRFLSTVAEHLESKWVEHVPIHCARYPNIVYFVNGEVAKVETEIAALVGADTHLLEQAFNDNLSRGFEKLGKFFRTSRTTLENELTVERAAAIDAFFGSHVRAEFMEIAVRFTIASMRETASLFVDKKDDQSWFRQLDLVKTFASQRLQGPLTNAELAEIAHPLEILRNARIEACVRDDMVERVMRMLTMLRPMRAAQVSDMTVTVHMSPPR